MPQTIRVPVAQLTPAAPIIRVPISDLKPAAVAQAPVQGPAVETGPVAARGSRVDLSRSYDVAGGVRAGAASTMFQGGDLLRRLMGMDRIIERPDVQSAMTPPDSPAGRAGFAVEQAAEFMVPATRVARATRGASVLTRAAAEGATAAGAAAVQSGGDAGTTSTAGAIGAALPVVGAAVGGGLRAARRAAAGAQEGGVGGAVAGLVRQAVPSEPKVMLVQALKPRSTRTRFGDSLDLAMPELKVTEEAAGRPITSVKDLLEFIPIAKARVRAQYDALAGPMREMGTTVDLSSVADAVAKSIPSKTQLKTPARARNLLKQADVYRGRFSLEQAEQFLKETNAQLEAFYGKYPFAQRSTLAANPTAAALEAEAKALRTAIYTTLDNPGQGVAARQLQRRYGALLEVEEETVRRSNVAARQQPESLAEQIGNARAIGDIARGTYRVLRGDLTGLADIAGGRATRAATKFMKEQQTTDALIRRAFEGFTGRPTPVLMPPQR